MWKCHNRFIYNCHSANSGKLKINTCDALVIGGDCAMLIKIEAGSPTWYPGLQALGNGIRRFCNANVKGSFVVLAWR